MFFQDVDDSDGHLYRRRDEVERVDDNFDEAERVDVRLRIFVGVAQIDVTRRKSNQQHYDLLNEVIFKQTI